MSWIVSVVHHWAGRPFSWWVGADASGTVRPSLAARRMHHCGRANKRVALVGCWTVSSWLDVDYDVTTGSVSLCIWDKFDIFSQKLTAVFHCFGFVDIFESVVGPSCPLCCDIWIHCNCVNKVFWIRKTNITNKWGFSKSWVFFLNVLRFIHTLKPGKKSIYWQTK